jgi:hypothetical protein
MCSAISAQFPKPYVCAASMSNSSLFNSVSYTQAAMTERGLTRLPPSRRQKLDKHVAPVKLVISQQFLEHEYLSLVRTITR